MLLPLLADGPVGGGGVARGEDGCACFVADGGFIYNARVSSVAVCLLPEKLRYTLSSEFSGWRPQEEAGQCPVSSLGG